MTHNSATPEEASGARKQAIAVGFLYALPFLLHWFIFTSFPVRPVSGWLPAWSPAVAILGCLFWPMTALRFLNRTISSPELPLRRRIVLYFTWGLPPAIIAWLFWGKADILIIYLACLMLPTAAILQTIHEDWTGLRARMNLFSPLPMVRREFDRHNSILFLTWCWLNCLTLLLIATSFLVTNVFATKNGFDISRKAPFIAWSILIFGIPFTILQWLRMLDDNFDDAAKFKKYGIYSLAVTPLLGLAVLVTSYLPAVPKDFLIGQVVVMLIWFSIIFRRSGKQRSCPPFLS